MTQALRTLLDQSENERDAALARMLRAEERAAAARRQQQQLIEYRADYRRRAPALAGRAASIELVRCHQGFMQRLDQAISQQQLQLDAAEQQAASERAALLELETRLAAVRKLIERRAEEERRRGERREQRHTDELASQLHQRRTARH